MDTKRLEAFSDGVFAIAITLLILEVRLTDPAHRGDLSHRLGQAWPAYIAFLISFVTIGIMWANHHAIFRLIDRTSHGLVVANMMLLLCVSFLPFPTLVLGENLKGARADQHTAAFFYGASFVVTAVFFNVLWHTAAFRRRLLVPSAGKAVDTITRRYRLGPPSYLLATVVALWSMRVSIAIDGGLALLYFLPQEDPED
jgi:uncharacterized membrane protein